MTDTLAKTPLHDWHDRHQGKLVDFAGWAMPIHYGSISNEHIATRQNVTLFDVSHMGRISFEGPDAADLLNHILTRNVLKLRPNQVRYSVITNESGGILDDVLVYHWLDSAASPRYSLVVNASNRNKIVQWIDDHRGSFDAKLIDHTTQTAMIAVQGPKAIQTVNQLDASIPFAEWKYYTGQPVSFCGLDCFISRTGYTGEDGLELTIPAESALGIWEQLIEAGQAFQIQAAGLGARDTLRLEAAMPLYGHELDEATNPIQADLGFAINWDHEFIGKAAIESAANAALDRQRIGLMLDGKRVPREGYSILDAAGQPLGTVTSGTFAPTLQKSIAMGYVIPSAAAVGTELFVDIRGRHEAARVVKLPFYNRNSFSKGS
ncbi:MAG: glycine cleavage system aminomethyltransferase GcvT [Pirellulaceae bacterium]